MSRVAPHHARSVLFAFASTACFALVVLACSNNAGSDRPSLVVDCPPPRTSPEIDAGPYTCLVSHGVCVLGANTCGEDGDIAAADCPTGFQAAFLGPEACPDERERCCLPGGPSDAGPAGDARADAPPDAPVDDAGTDAGLDGATDAGATG
jgi:hypothetical protein